MATAASRTPNLWRASHATSTSAPRRRPHTGAEGTVGGRRLAIAARTCARAQRKMRLAGDGHGN
eukprot:5440694-Prymnesium_polylepis.1